MKNPMQYPRQFGFIKLFLIFFAIVSFTAYRVNKYCGQHLIVANEVQDVDSDPLPLPRARSTPDDDEERAEPVAEALIQNDQNFHHLKILTSSAERPVHVPYEPIKPTKQKNKNRRIYSQVSDFYLFIVSVSFCSGCF